jgi:bifunctional N-acetylglucosamine-1-phosphate-uridyltransferase/glucosamine-1-phosphate-acetyltransferase GlmU-like protein
MKILLTLSGNSERFTSKGYPIKQLIDINGKSILNYVLDMFDGCANEDFIFLTRKNDISKYALESAILNLKPGAAIYAIDQNNYGPVYSISNIFDKIPDDEEIVISYTDFTQAWNFQDFISFCRQTKSDGCVVTHEGFHSHKLYNKSFAFLRTNGHDVLEIQEKKAFTDASDNEPASNGVYYFKTGALSKKYFKQLMNEKKSVNGEYYVTLPYNLMINDGLKVTHYNKSKFICFGVPDDVDCFKAWHTILNKNNCNKNNIKDLFNFWSDYFNAA